MPGYDGERNAVAVSVIDTVIQIVVVTFDRGIAEPIWSMTLLIIVGGVLALRLGRRPVPSDLLHTEASCSQS